MFRITFSKSLAELIAKQTDFDVKRVKLYLGEIEPDTQLFAICKKESGWPLRVTFFKECIDLWESPTTIFKGCKIEIIN